MTHHVLMCEPVHFRIAYEINPWMRLSNAIDAPRALAQWRGLRDVLDRVGVNLEFVQQDDSVPDMTFTANAGLVLNRRFIPSNFRHPERQPEAPLFSDWFAARGYSVDHLEGPASWEGEGDVLEADGNIFAGYGFRTDAAALDALEVTLGRPVTRLELTDPRFYHLDTCFCPLGDGRALYYPPAFSSDARAAIEVHFADLIAVPDIEALRFACNAVVVDRTVVMNTGAPATTAGLQSRGFEVEATPTDEFIKAGGSVKCLLLTLDGFAPPREA